MQRGGPFDWGRITKHAEGNRSARMLRVGLGLVERLMGMPPPAEVSAWSRQDPAVPGLIAEIERRLWDQKRPGDYDRIFRSTMESKRDRLWYWWDVVAQPTPLEWEIIALPRGLQFLYFPLRFGRLLFKRLKSWIGFQ